MKIKLVNKEFNLRTKIRIVMTTDIMDKGEVVASGEAVLNPKDKFDLMAGARLSGERAVKNFTDAAERNLGIIRPDYRERLRAAISWDRWNAPYRVYMTMKKRFEGLRLSREVQEHIRNLGNVPQN